MRACARWLPVYPLVAGFWLSGCSSVQVDPSAGERPTFDSSAGAGGFDAAEAKDAIEFCVDLDSQDDLVKDLSRGIPEERSLYRARPSAKWKKIADSRELYAPGQRDPGKNGFPPFNSAWTLWRQTAPGPGGRSVFAATLRGTVVESAPSVWQDIVIATIAARNGMEYSNGKNLSITFADMPRAEVHAGFAYGAFDSLFDAKYGLLPKIVSEADAGSIVIVTGHSQGAAMATLAHAFLHYAMQERKFGLGAKNYALKSYVFAQPKPGNSQFGMNFAEIAGNRNNAFVFNNTLDPVAQVPLTLGFLADADADMPDNKSVLSKFVRWANNVFNSIRNGIDRVFTGNINKVQHKQDFYLAEELARDSTSAKPEAVSQTYVSAGLVIPLRGRPKGDYYPEQKVDDFIQHHATTYRWLLEEYYPQTKSGR
jgi:hypothetical protein